MKRTVLAHGTFDILHPGHIDYLRLAKSKGDYLIVAIGTDRMATVRKGEGRPINTHEDRKAVVQAVQFVDETTIAPDPTDDLLVNMLTLVKEIKPAVFVTSYPGFIERYADVFEDLDVEIVIDDRKVNSSTEIINRIVRRYGKNPA